MGRKYFSKLNGLGRRTLMHVINGRGIPVKSYVSALGRRVYAEPVFSRQQVRGGAIRRIADNPEQGRLVTFKKVAKAPSVKKVAKPKATPRTGVKRPTKSAKEISSAMSRAFKN